MLLNEAAAVDFVRDAFGHLKTIGHSPEAAPLLEKAGVKGDNGVITLGKDSGDFIAAVSTRQWDREPTLRTLT